MIQLALLTPADPGDIPDYTTSCLAHEAVGRRQNGIFVVMAFVFPSNPRI